MKEGGFAMADIVRATYYITDPADADAHARGLRRSSSATSVPAATLLVVAGLYKPEMKVEIEVTAKRRTDLIPFAVRRIHFPETTHEPRPRPSTRRSPAPSS